MKWVISPRNVIAHVITSVENVDNLSVLKFAVTQNSRSRIRDKRLVEVRVAVVEIPAENLSMGKTRETHKAEEIVNQLTENQMAEEDDADSDDFYVFSAGATDEENTLELIIEDKLINTVIDTGASCNLMSAEVFNFVTGSRVKVLECTKKVYAYASVKPLQLKGKCILSIGVPQTHQSLGTEFYITCGKAATLPGRKTSELLDVLRVGVSINSCEIKADGPQDQRCQSMKIERMR